MASWSDKASFGFLAINKSLCSRIVVFFCFLLSSSAWTRAAETLWMYLFVYSHVKETKITRLLGKRRKNRTNYLVVIEWELAQAFLGKTKRFEYEMRMNQPKVNDRLGKRHEMPANCHTDNSIPNATVITSGADCKTSRKSKKSTFSLLEWKHLPMKCETMNGKPETRKDNRQIPSVPGMSRGRSSTWLLVKIRMGWKVTRANPENEKGIKKCNFYLPTCWFVSAHRLNSLAALLFSAYQMHSVLRSIWLNGVLCWWVAFWYETIMRRWHGTKTENCNLFEITLVNIMWHAI